MIAFKKISIENRPYYFFSDIINIQNFDPNLLRIDKISFKTINAVFYCIKYITMKSLNDVNFDCKNSRYLVFNGVGGYIGKIKEDNYQISASTDKNKEVLEKYTELSDQIKTQIETINGSKPIEYKKDFIKIRFEADDDLPLGRVLSIPVIVVTGSIFQEGSKYYPQVVLHECVYKSVGKSQRVCTVLLVIFS